MNKWLRVYFSFTVMLPSPELGFGMRLIVVTRRILLLQPCRCFSQNKDRFDACMGSVLSLQFALPCLELHCSRLTLPCLWLTELTLVRVFYAGWGKIKVGPGMEYVHLDLDPLHA